MNASRALDFPKEFPVPDGQTSATIDDDLVLAIRETVHNSTCRIPLERVVTTLVLDSHAFADL